MPIIWTTQLFQFKRIGNSTLNGISSMAKLFGLNYACFTFIFTLTLIYLRFYQTGPLACPDGSQFINLNDRCRFHRFAVPRDDNVLLQCASATSYDIRDALVRYSYRRCQSIILFLDILSYFGNDTLDLADDTFDSIASVRIHLQLWGLTWIIPKNWNEMSSFALDNQVQQLHLVSMRFVAPNNMLPFDLFKGLNQIERIAIFHTELPLIEEGFFDVFPKLTCLKLYNISIPCTCNMKWFHEWIVTNQFVMIFNGDMDCGIYNTNCYGNGLDSVWILSPDVDATLEKCAKPSKLDAASVSLMIPNALSEESLDFTKADAYDHSKYESKKKNRNPTVSSQSRSDLDQPLDPISLECRPNGFRIFIPLRMSPVTKASFLNASNQTYCTSSGNVESSDKMLVLTSNYSTCGTVMTDDDESLMFQNVVVVEHPEPENVDTESSLIERMTFSMIPVLCTFMRTDQFSFLQTSDLQPATIRRMKDPLSGVNKAQVKIQIVHAVVSALNNVFSFDVYADAITDQRVSLMVEQLFATSSNSSADLKRYQIIVDGCYKDSTLEALPLTDGKIGYRFKMTPFKFRGDASNDVYLHGHAILCNNFSEKCEFNCYPQPQFKSLQETPRSMDNVDIVNYSNSSILRAAELL